MIRSIVCVGTAQVIVGRNPEQFPLLHRLPVQVVLQNVFQDPVRVTASREGTLTGRLQAPLTVISPQTQNAQTGIISLLGEAFACKYMGDIFPGAGAHRFGLAQKISTVPASLLMILPVPFGHVFFKGGIPVLAVTSFMQCDALMLQVDLHGFGIIDRLQGLADILMRHAVVMPILAQGNMIVLLHFGPYAMPDLVRLSWQGLQQRLLLLLETLQPSPFLS